MRQSFAKHAELPAIEGRHLLYSYRELDRQSAALARAMAAAGVTAGDIVPLLVRRSPALVVAQVAIVRLGAAYAPIDLASPPARQQAMLDMIKPSVVITDGSVSLANSPGVTVLNVNDVRERSSDDATATWQMCDPSALAYVMFTSGTSGVPKGVMVPQSGIVRLVCDADFAEMRVGSRWGFLSSPAFDASTLEVWAPLFNGGCCVVQEELRPSLDDLAAFLLANRVTDSWLTAALFSSMVDDRLGAFRHLRQLLAGGERVSPHHARVVLKAFPQLRLINGYGPTENTTFTLCHTVTLADTDDPNGIPIGKVVRGTTVRIGMDATEPSDGELLATGAGTAIGYLGDRELTDAKFVRVGGERWYRTGDLVRRRDDGVFEFHGRADRQVKLRGNRIELDGVERVLARCPGVGLAAVLVRGESAESRHLVAWYSGAGGPPPSIDSVTAFLAKELPPGAVPNPIHPVAQLPLTTSGKADYPALERMAIGEAVPVAHDSRWESDSERRLAAIWHKCIPAAQVDRDTSFVALGGTSLLALQVSARVRRELGRDLTPIDVLRTPILADQARCIDAAATFDVDAESDVPADAQLPLTQVQRGILGGTQLDASGCAYLVHVALQIDRMPNRRKLQRAFETLAKRHPSLRLTIRNQGDPRHAQVQPKLPGVWWHEYAALSTMPADLEWPMALLDVVNRPIDLARDGVMRVDFWPVAGGSSLLVWTIHHVSIDEASIDHCLGELDALLNGKKLDPVYGSPFGFASIEKAATDHDAAREWSSRFVEALAGVEPPLPRAPRRGREVSVPLPAGLSDRMHQACGRWGITPFAPLLVAYGGALQEVFGGAQRFVSTPFSRRAEPELLEPAGCLLDMAVVEAGSRATESAGEALARVNDAVLALQRPRFLSHAAVAEMVARRDRRVAWHLGTFGFTWRLAPTRNILLGPEHGRLLRVQVAGARFGLALHAWLQDGELRCSVEGIDAVFDGDRADALGRTFGQWLEALCRVAALPGVAPVADERSPTEGRKLTPEVASQLRQAWSRWTGMPAAAIVGSTNFLESGGNSLTVMRMVAQLRREHGLNVDVGAFLARPTLANFYALASQPITRTPSCSLMVGRMDAARVVVLIGDVLGSYTLANEIQRQLGQDHAVLIADIEAMFRRAPVQPPQFLRDRLVQLVREIGTGRVIALVGYSLAGSFALLLARRFPGGKSPPIWLLDTYAPFGAIRRAFDSATIPIAHTLLRSRIVADAVGTYTRAGTAHSNPTTRGLVELWHSSGNGLARESTEQLDAEVHLVKARQTFGGAAGLFWRRGSNGFDPARYTGWHLHEFDARHADLLSRFAPEIAELISSGLRERT